MKKYLSFFLVLIFTLGIPTSAFAETITEEGLISTMTSNSDEHGTATSSYNYSTTQPFWAFDKINTNETNSAWVSDQLPAWLGYEFTTETIVKRYTITGQKTGGDNSSETIKRRHPKSWTFEAFDKELNDWVVLDEQSGITDWVNATKKDFVIDSNKAFSKYRINISASIGPSLGDGKTYVAIGEMEMYGSRGTVTPSTTIDIESVKDKVFLNETFTVQAVLNNATNIYAEDFNIQYDKSKFELVGVQAADHMGLFHNSEVSEDTIRLITASLGKDYGINDQGTLVNLTFKAIGLGIGKVDATKGKIADNGTTEITLTEENCGEKEIEVIGGDFTLKHLGLLGYNYNLDKSNLTDDLQALLGSTGNVVDMDLTELTKTILANPNYDFNN